MNRPNPMLDEVKKILPQIAANAVQAEQARKVPEENIRLLKSIQLHRAFQPKYYGGLELSLPEVTDCVAALAGAVAVLPGHLVCSSRIATKWRCFQNKRKMNFGLKILMQLPLALLHHLEK